MKNEKFAYYFIGLIFLFFTFFTPLTFANSEYVLPYPSSMPGSRFYVFRLAYEKISGFWYFGDFGQFDFNLKLSDKYLVEAKTLFEYKQYLLGYNALGKSNRYFVNTLPNLLKAEKNRKNTRQRKVVLREAIRKHVEVLEQIKKNIPNTFVWQPEKSVPISLDLEKTLNNSIKLRHKEI